MCFSSFILKRVFQGCSIEFHSYSEQYNTILSSIFTESGYKSVISDSNLTENKIFFVYNSNF
ncbi:MAG: hypothetical protein LCH54_04490 [Bacteroidetes bacterium]|nr:hypothetical protein [Bacteroidota bacterium]